MEITDTPKAVITQYPDGVHIIVTRNENGTWITRTYRTRTFATALKFKRDIHAGRV